MSYIKFANETQLETKMINKVNIFSKGASRDALEIFFNGASHDFNELLEIASNADNLGTLTVIDNDTAYLYPNYEIFHALKYENSEYVLTIGQLTEQEVKYNDLLARIEALEK